MSNQRRSVFWNLQTHWMEDCGLCHGPCTSIRLYAQSIVDLYETVPLGEWSHLVDETSGDVLEQAVMLVEGARDMLQRIYGAQLPLAWD